jgi:hypothetical protein
MKTGNSKLTKEKKLSYDGFKQRVDSLRSKVDSFSKDWQVSPEHYKCYTDDLKLFNHRGEIIISMMDERDGEIRGFRIKDNFTDIWILANFFYLSRKEIKEIINSIKK